MKENTSHHCECKLDKCDAQKTNILKGDILWHTWDTCMKYQGQMYKFKYIPRKNMCTDTAVLHC